MKKIALLMGLLLVVGFRASAQDMNKVDIFGGYSYLRFNPGSGASSINLNGGVGSFAYNLTDHIAGVAELGGNHGTLSGVGVTSFSYLFGPKIYAKMEKVTPFAQVLFGGVHGSCSDCSASANAFGMALGGGVDWNVHDRISVRLAQVDYVYTRFSTDLVELGSSQNNFRYSVGVVIHF